MKKTSKVASKIRSKKKVAASPAKKGFSAKSEMGIKYADKSGGQPQIAAIFEEIKKLLLPYQKGTMKIRGGIGGQILLVNKKEVLVAGKIRQEMWFASALVQKGFVSFYFMPVYTDSAAKKGIKPELLKCLKGKSCFHIKKFDKEIFSQIEEALQLGYESFKQKGWI